MGCILTVTRKKGAVSAEKLSEILKNSNNKVAKIGWFETAKYEDGTSVAYIASIQEFGNSRIPARLGMRKTIANKRNHWQSVLNSEFKKVIENKSTLDKALELIGIVASGDFRETITKVVSPPLKPSTIKARLRKRANGKTIGLLTKPLIDSKLLLNSLTYKVTNK